MELQKLCRGGVGALSQGVGGRPLDNAQQQVEHQAAPQQAEQPLGHFDRVAVEQTRRPAPLHDSSQGSAARLAAKGVERPGDLGRARRLGNRQPEDGDDGGIADLLQEPRADGGQRPRQALAVTELREVSRHASRSARSLMQATSISCLLPTNSYNARFDTRARVAISSVLVSA